MSIDARNTYLSSIPLNNTYVIESSELVPSGASTRFASSSSVAVTRTSSTALSIGSSSSAAQPQYVRFNPKSRAITTAITLTLASGTGTGKVDIYAYLKADNTTLAWWVVDTSGNTFTFTSQTAKTAPNAQPPIGAILIYSWTITSGAYDTSGGTDQQLSTDCWVDAIEVSNQTGSAATITIIDGQGTAIDLFNTTSVAANAVLTYTRGGGRFFDGGIFLQAGTASALQVNIRMARLRRTQQNP